MRARTVLAAALAAGFLLAGCSATTSTDAAVEGGAPVVAGDMAVSGEMPAGEGAAVDGKVATAPTPVNTARQVIRTGYVSMQVDDVTKSAFDVHALIKKRNGLISSEDTQSSGDMTYANISAQIPADSLDDFIADVSALGTVTSINVTAQDVTTQVVDLDARIKALQTSIDRLTELLAQASRIEDLLAIETQLAQRQAELDSLTAQRQWLGDQVAMSTITVSLSPVTQIADVDAPGFLSGLQSGWAAFLSLIMVAVTAVGFFLPFLLVLAVIAVPLAIVLVRQSRRHRRVPTAPTAPTAPAEPRQEAGSGTPT
jgi:outer membrane murein-binding lipoprotein Lpp